MLRALKVVESRPDRETAPKFGTKGGTDGMVRWGAGSVHSARMLSGGVYRWKTQNRSPFAR
jgi:hypothetical protein